tara:strand:- start:4314 stop:4475 length:162 start_codon:yes stop_codon:yes gene_type:complete
MTAKRWLAALVACGHFTTNTNCPCCILKRTATTRVINRKKRKSKIEREIGEER